MMPGAPPYPQSLGDAARKEKDRRQKQHQAAPPARSYTDADLKAAPTPDGSPSPPLPDDSKRPPRSSLSGDWQGSCEETLVRPCPSPTPQDSDCRTIGGARAAPDRMSIVVDDDGNLRVDLGGLVGAGPPGGEGHIGEDWTLEVHSPTRPYACEGVDRPFRVEYDGRVVTVAENRLQMSMEALVDPCPQSRYCSFRIRCSFEQVWRPLPKVQR